MICYLRLLVSDTSGRSGLAAPPAWPGSPSLAGVGAHRRPVDCDGAKGAGVWFSTKRMSGDRPASSAEPSQLRRALIRLRRSNPRLIASLARKRFSRCSAKAFSPTMGIRSSDRVSHSRMRAVKVER